jgi:hypothetical protein
MQNGMSALPPKTNTCDALAHVLWAKRNSAVVVAHETSAALRPPKPIYSQMILEKRASTKNQVGVK